MILNFTVFVFYSLGYSTSFIISCTVIITNGFHYNEIPPVFWIICFTCFFLSQLKHNCKEHPALITSFVCKWFIEDFRLCCWFSSLCNLTLVFPPDCSFLLSKPSSSVCQGIALGSVFNFIFSQWERSCLCCQLPLLKHSAPHYSWSYALEKQLSTQQCLLHTS